MSMCGPKFFESENLDDAASTIDDYIYKGGSSPTYTVLCTAMAPVCTLFINSCKRMIYIFLPILFLLCRFQGSLLCLTAQICDYSPEARGKQIHTRKTLAHIYILLMETESF